MVSKNGGCEYEVWYCLAGASFFFSHVANMADVMRRLYVQVPATRMLHQ
jgi:hypothetical protein